MGAVPGICAFCSCILTYSPPRSAGSRRRSPGKCHRDGHDAAGRYMSNLTPMISSQEDGVPHKRFHTSARITTCRSASVFILDTSGSMERKIRTAVEAVDRFVRRTHEDDDIFLMTFSSDPSAPGLHERSR